MGNASPTLNLSETLPGYMVWHALRFLGIVKVKRTS